MLFDKMYKYEMDPIRTVGATEGTRDAPSHYHSFKSVQLIWRQATDLQLKSKDLTMTKRCQDSSPSADCQAKWLSGQLLTHCGLAPPYGNKELGQYELMYWLVAWRHQTIARTNVDLSIIRELKRQPPVDNFTRDT